MDRSRVSHNLRNAAIGEGNIRNDSPVHKLLEISLKVAPFQESCQPKFQPRPYSLND